MRPLLLVLVACSGPTEPVATEVENVGEVCVYANDPPRAVQSFSSGAPLYLRYTSVAPMGGFALCLSSSCSRDRSAMCSVVQTEAGLEVTTLARWIDTTQEQQACTSDCLVLTALCSTEPLGSGEHRIAFATQMVTLQIPSESAEAPCMDFEP